MSQRFDPIKLVALAALLGFLKYPVLLAVAAVLGLIWLVQFIRWMAGGAG